MPINDEELLAAVSGGVDSAAPVAPVETPQETPDADETDVADAGTDDADGDAGGDAGEVPDAEAGDAGAEADDGKEGEPEIDPKTGKPVVKAKEGEEEPTAEIDPATGKPFTAEQVKAKKDKEDFTKAQLEDPINAPIPKYLKEVTGQRMRKLVDIAKELTVKHETAMNDRNEIIGMITDTGATATQYTSALQYLKMVNSRDPVQIKQAIGVMQQELAALSRMAGVPVAGVDNLANHPDLKQALEAKQITAELAEEIAARREREVVEHQQLRAAHQQTEQGKLEHAAGVTALNNVGKQLAAKDPNYRAKAVAVLQEIQADLQKLPPSQWAQAFLVAYTTHRPKVAAPAVRKTPVVPKNQPLRGNNPSGGQQVAPKSLDEAISMGIAAGTRR